MTLKLTEINPGLTDRACFVGQTGCGKTTLARYLLQYRKYVVCIDGKDSLKWAGYKRLTTLKKVVEDRSDRIIYAPNDAELRDETYINAFFHWVYKRKNTTVYIDEVYSITDGEVISDYYHACLTRGRERNVSVFSATQRPKQIPQAIMSESEHFYMFRLALPQDRKKMTEIVPIKEAQIMALEKREFFYGTIEGDLRGPLTLNLK